MMSASTSSVLQRPISADPAMMRLVLELSDRLECDLDLDTLRTLVELCELGVNTEGLANVVVDIKLEKSRKHEEKQKTRKR